MAGVVEICGICKGRFTADMGGRKAIAAAEKWREEHECLVGLTFKSTFAPLLLAPLASSDDLNAEIEQITADLVDGLKNASAEEKRKVAVELGTLARHLLDIAMTLVPADTSSSSVKEEVDPTSTTESEPADDKPGS